MSGGFNSENRRDHQCQRQTVSVGEYRIPPLAGDSDGVSLKKTRSTSLASPTEE